MNVLVLGSGGREHALVRALRRSPSVKALYCAPANPGIQQIAQAAHLDPFDFEAVAKFVGSHGIGLVVPGSETLIAAGIKDFLPQTAVFAPSKAAARLESSKRYSTLFRQRLGIPSPRAFLPDSLNEAMQAASILIKSSGCAVIKADGLCAGKGVFLAHTFEEAQSTLQALMIEQKLGQAGTQVVLEEFVQGQEISLFAVCHGTQSISLPPAKDYKKLLDGDLGPNTGGMGAYAPIPWLGPGQIEHIERHILKPTLRGMQQEGTPYEGLLYIGLMLTEKGPVVLEYNARFGDPEAQVLLPLLQSDLAALMLDCCKGRLPGHSLAWRQEFAVCVVLASNGYPSSGPIGKPILGIERIHGPNCWMDHAGTAWKEDKLVTAGGRVLGVTALGNTLQAAAQAAHAAANEVHFDGLRKRTDIGKDAL